MLGTLAMVSRLAKVGQTPSSAAGPLASLLQVLEKHSKRL